MVAFCIYISFAIETLFQKATYKIQNILYLCSRKQQQINDVYNP